MHVVDDEETPVGNPRMAGQANPYSVPGSFQKEGLQDQFTWKIKLMPLLVYGVPTATDYQR